VATAAPVEPNHREASPAMRTTVELIDRFASYFGRATAWLIIPMTVAVTWEVVARHVRTDMLYSRWSIRRQNKIDAIGYFFFFFPAMIFLFYFGWQEAYHSFQIGETSDASPWRPIVWPFKFVIPITALFLLIQGIAELLKSLYASRTGREWVHREHLEIG
jgi:TRAP-type mannitol/chloroaromatic compound transport system permease small subunit